MSGGLPESGPGRSAQRLSILYVLAYPRSGTTVLGNLLGELDGYFHAGEVTYLWAPDLVAPRRRCGCGNALDECQVWHDVYASAFPEAFSPRTAARPVSVDGDGHQRPDTSLPTISHAFVPSVATPMSRMRGDLIGRRAYGRTLLRRSATKGDLARYRQSLAKLYHGMAAVTGAQVIVDSSKLLQDAEIVAGVPGIDVRILHVVRDGRGVALSRMRRMSPLRPDGTRQMSKRRLTLEAARWTMSNAAMEFRLSRLECPSMVLRYEAFVADPKTTIRQIAGFAGKPVSDFGFLHATDEGWAASVGLNHTSGGNRNRWTRGTVALTEDVRWTSELGPADRRLASLATWGGRARYGYTGRPQRLLAGRRHRLQATTPTRSISSIGSHPDAGAARQDA